MPGLAVATNNSSLPLSPERQLLAFEEAVNKALAEGTFDTPMGMAVQVDPNKNVNIPLKGTDGTGNPVENKMPVNITPTGNAIGQYPQNGVSVPLALGYDASLKKTANPSLYLPAASPSPTTGGVSVQTFAVTGVAGGTAVQTFVIICGSGQIGLLTYYALNAPQNVIKPYDEFTTAELAQLGGANGALAYSSLVAGLDNYAYCINLIRFQTSFPNFGSKRITVYKANYADTGVDGRPFPISVMQSDRSFNLTIGMVDFLRIQRAPLILTRDMALVIPVDGSVAPAAPETLTMTFELGMLR